MSVGMRLPTCSVVTVGFQQDRSRAGSARKVMNTQEQLRKAFEEYNQGTFLKHKGVFR